MAYEPVGRIAPVVPTPSLLTSARPLPGGTNWSSGIAWTPVCQPSSVYELCPPYVNRDEADDRATEHTLPFVIYTPMSCDSIGATGSDAVKKDAEAIVRDLTEVHTAAGIAGALWMGTGYPAADTAIPTLRNSAVDVSGAAPYDLDDGIASLLTHYEMATGGNGGAIIHMQTHLVVNALGGGGGGARICWPEGTLYRGPLGSTISPGPGYPLGSSPNGPNGHGPWIGGVNYAGNEAGHAWIYVTGPVEYAVSEVRAIPEREIDRVPFRTNIYELWGERDAIVRFDPCSVFAVKVLSTVSLVEVS